MEATNTYTYDLKSNFIKWLAILTMTIDHIGAFLFPEITFLRVIGRIAFPCFLYTTVLGTKRTRNFKRYILQMLVIGIISLPVTYFDFNILFALALFALSIKDNRFFIPCMLLSFFVEYSIYGFLLGWCIYWLVEKDWKVGTLLFIGFQLLQLSSIQFYAIFAIIPILIPKINIPLIKVPKWFGYLFYPAHRLVLLLLARLL